MGVGERAGVRCRRVKVRFGVYFRLGVRGFSVVRVRVELGCMGDVRLRVRCRS